jgi:uncharacterized protein involved in exopolysaccharide biosynthesis
MVVTAGQYGTSRREFLIFFYKYRTRLFLSFLIPFLIAVAVSFVPTPRYRAASVLIVRLGSEYVYRPEISNSQNGESTIPFVNEQIYKSEVAILGSEDLHRQVINTLGVDTLFPEISHPEGIHLFLSGVHKLIDAELKRLGLAQDEKLTPEQIEQRKLADAVSRFDKRFDIQLEKESAVITVTFEHKDAQLAIKALDTLLTLYYEKRKQIFIEPRAELAETQMKATHEHAVGAQHALENYKLNNRVYLLDDQRRQLLAERADAQRQAMAISSPELDARIANLTRQLDQLDVTERGIMSLQKESDIASDSYSLHARQLDEAKAYEDLQRERIGAVRIIQPPTAPPEPKKIQALIILAGAFVSLVFTLLVAAFTEFSRRGFLAPEQIERSIGLPVLAVIPLHRHP